MLIDDPHSVTEVESDAMRATVIDKYDQEIVSRLNNMNEDPIILIMQRIHYQDLTGHLMELSDDWVNVSIAMEYDGSQGFNGADIGMPELKDPRTKDGELLFPERFNRKTLNTLKKHLGSFGTAGQLQQSPVPKGGGIIKDYWWKTWADDKPLPKCEHLFSSWDTAYSEADLKNNAYSAFTMWGVFWNEYLDDPAYCLLLTKAWAGQVGYPDLRKKAKEIDKTDRLDCQLIEKKASGISLVQELRQSGMKIRTYAPDRDKIARAYSVSAMFESGQVYIPNRNWARKVVNNVSQFPNGAPPSADITDTVTQALIYLRNSWWVSHPDDELNKDINVRPNEIAKADNEWDNWDDELKLEKVTAAYG